MAAATISLRVGAAVGSVGAGAGATASSAWRFAAGESSAFWPLARFRAEDI